MEIKTCCFWLVTAVASMGLFAPAIVKWLLTDFVATKVQTDFEEFNLQTLAELRDEENFKGQRYLVVGGTKGIGRGIAVALAGAGAHVDIVGRTGGEEAVEKMKIAARNAGTGDSAQFNFWRADLSSFAGCSKLVENIVNDRFDKLRAARLKQAEEKDWDIWVHELQTYEQRQYHGVVFTLGVWPDFNNPLSPDGFDRVVFTDIIARYSVWRGLLGSRLIRYGSSVMSVLSSGMRAPDTPRLVEDVKQKFKRYDTQKKKHDYHTSVTQMSVIAPLGDLLLHLMSSENPEMAVIGTHPGLVETNVLDVTLGHLAASLIFTILRSLRLTFTEEQSGLRHLNILNHENSGLNFVDQYLIYREAPQLLENDDLFEWLKEKLNPMTEDVFFGGAQAVTKAKEVYEYEED